MTEASKLLVSVMAATAAVSSFAQTSLVLDGGFESGNLSGWGVVDAGASTRATGDSRFVHSGNFGAQLGRVYALNQTLQTIPGQKYEIEFWVKYVDDYWEGLGSPATPNEFTIKWLGTVLLDLVDLGRVGWVHYRLSATASSATTYFQILGSPFTLSYFAVDDVRVNLVPTVGSVSNVRASQHPGTALVDLFYDLQTAGYGSFVAVSVSSDGGASFNIPATHFSGDGVTSLATPGSDRHIVWDAGADLGAGYFPNIVVRLSAGAVPAASGVFAVDLRGMPGELTVQGRVRDALTRALLNGVTVGLAGLARTTSGDGSFSFALVSLPSGNSLTVSKSGYLTDTESITVPPGAIGVVLPDICLQPAGGTKPVVTGIRAKYDGIFLSGASMLNQYTASVNWNGLTPSSVEFYVNGSLTRTVSTSTTEAAADMDMGLGFFGSLTLGANKVSAVAVSSDGTRSARFDQPVTILHMPLFLVDQAILLPFEFIPGNQPAMSWEFNFPRSFLSARDVQQIPFFGKFGPDFNFDVAFDYQVLTGEWGLFAGKEWDKRLHYRSGVRPHTTPLHPKFYFGNLDFDWGFGGKAEGIASQTRGIVVERVGVQLSAGVRTEILSFYFTDYVPGGQLVRLLDKLKGLGIDVNSIQRVRLDGLFDAELSAMLKFPSLAFDNATLNLQPGVEAIYEPSVWVAHGSIAVGGNLGFDLQLAPRFGME